VDLQHNGALGFYFPKLDESGPEPLYKIADLLRYHGIGRCLLTFSSNSIESLIASAKIVDKELSQNPELEKLFFGVFHEGVFISPEEGWRGAHSQKWVRNPDYDLLKKIDDASGGRIKMVNVAPEEPGGLDFVEKAANDGKLVALGHCCPDAKTIKEATNSGASIVTHFGNGAAPMMHRFKNPFWEFLNNPNLRLGLICDGFHLPPSLVGTALKCKGVENCFPVSDAGGYSGCKPGRYKRDGGSEFVIEKNGFMHMADSEILCGAWFQMDKCVDFLVRELDLDFVEAWRMCSRVPAKIIGLDLPEIKTGSECDFVIASWDDGIVFEEIAINGIVRD
jgi:N-acetylglucosamine-6-phosphate deacetylase